MITDRSFKYYYRLKTIKTIKTQVSNLDGVQSQLYLHYLCDFEKMIIKLCDFPFSLDALQWTHAEINTATESWPTKCISLDLQPLALRNQNFEYVVENIIRV